MDNDYKDLLEQVAGQLTGIFQEEMTEAEVNISNKLVKAGMVEWVDDEGDQVLREIVK